MVSDAAAFACRIHTQYNQPGSLGQGRRPVHTVDRYLLIHCGQTVAAVIVCSRQGSSHMMTAVAGTAVLYCAAVEHSKSKCTAWENNRSFSQDCLCNSGTRRFLHIFWWEPLVAAYFVLAPAAFAWSIIGLTWAAKSADIRHHGGSIECVSLSCHFVGALTRLCHADALGVHISPDFRLLNENTLGMLGYRPFATSLTL